MSISPMTFFTNVGYGGFLIGLVASLVGLFFLLKDNTKYSIYVAAVCVFGVANIYFLFIPIDNPFFDAYISNIGDWQEELVYGVYVNALLSIAFLVTALNEKGIFDEITKKGKSIETEAIVAGLEKGAADGLKSATDGLSQSSQKLKTSLTKLSKKAKIVIGAVIILAAIAGGYYKFVFTPTYTAYEFEKLWVEEWNKEKDAAMAAGTYEKRAFREDFASKSRAKHSRMILTNSYVLSTKQLFHEESTTYNEEEENTRKPIWILELAPYKVLDDGRTVAMAESRIDPVDLTDENFSKTVRVEVYDESVFLNKNIKYAAMEVAPCFEDYSKGCDALSGFYRSEVTVKVKCLDENTYELLEVISVKEVESPSRTIVEEYFEIDYSCLLERFSNTNYRYPQRLYNPEYRECVKQIKPIVGSYFGDVTQSGNTLQRVDSTYWGTSTNTYKQEYKGELMYGLPSGNGVQIWKFKDDFYCRIEGTFENGEAHGECVQTFADSTTYEGDFVHGLSEGKGTQTFANGSMYVGDWKNDNFDGKGVLTFGDGASYEGDFVAGQKTGFGVYKLTDGGYYEGGVLEGRAHGKGKRIQPDGSGIEGVWINDVLQGEGVPVHVARLKQIPQQMK